VDWVTVEQTEPRNTRTCSPPASRHAPEGQQLAVDMLRQRPGKLEGVSLTAAEKAGRTELGGATWMTRTCLLSHC
jgi:hypothetical protein